jgi:hypothetical protein
MKDTKELGKIIGLGCLAIVGLTICAVSLIALGHAIGLFGEAAQTTREQVGPKAILKKYEWFKDAAAMLDKKTADIKVYESRITNMKEGNGNKNVGEWSRGAQEQYYIWLSEVAGIKASYNGLAAEYNSNMSKVNYAFCNTGQLPEGSTSPLPREFKPYIDK